MADPGLDTPILKSATIILTSIRILCRTWRLWNSMSIFRRLVWSILFISQLLDRWCFGCRRRKWMRRVDLSIKGDQQMGHRNWSIRCSHHFAVCMGMQSVSKLDWTVCPTSGMCRRYCLKLSTSSPARDNTLLWGCMVKYFSLFCIYWVIIIMIWVCYQRNREYQINYEIV